MADQVKGNNDDYGSSYRRDDRDDRRDRDGERRRRLSPDERGDRRDRDRYHERSRDHRSRRSGSNERSSRHRSRSRSKSPAYDPNRKRRRPTWFDIPPIGGAPPPLSQLPGAVQVISGPVAPAATTASTFGGAASQQATRHARRIYVGGLPPSVSEEALTDFISNALAAVGGTTAGPGSCVLNNYVNYEKRFAFIELRTVEETSNAMALDGIMFEGVAVRVRRPADYNPASAASLGPSVPNPNLNLAAIGLDKRQEAAAAPGAGALGSVPGMHPDAAHRIFVGGLPYYLEEPQIRELLGAFGAIKSFDMIRDKETRQFKGYGFVVFEDPSVTEMAIAGLHGMRMGDRQLTVRRANEGQRLIDMQTQGVQPQAVAPRVVKLIEAVTMEELSNDDDYSDILEDMREECGKYGSVVEIHIPRPGPPGEPPIPGVGKVLIEFADPAAAMAARNAMHGRTFSGRTVVATLITEEDYRSHRWD